MGVTGSQTSLFGLRSAASVGTNQISAIPPTVTGGGSNMSNLMGLMFGVSAIANLTSSISESLSQRAFADAQKSAFGVNKRIAELQAKDAIKRGDREADLYAKKIKRIIGTQRAGLAAQGIELDTGSALDLQLDTAEYGAIDVQTIRHNAYREAWGYKVEALDYGSKGSFASLEGKAKSRNTLVSGGLRTLNLGFSYYKSTSLEDFLT